MVRENMGSAGDTCRACGANNGETGGWSDVTFEPAGENAKEYNRGSPLCRLPPIRFPPPASVSHPELVPMRKMMALGLTMFAVGAAAEAPRPVSSPQQPSDGWTPIFDGRSLDGWYARPHLDPRKFAAMDDRERRQKLEQWSEEAAQHWSIEDGVLINDGAGPYLVTAKDYSDYDLMLEYKTVPRADSGIYLKGTPQVQIWDSTDEKKFRLGAHLGSGGLWNNRPGSQGKDPSELADRPFGQWNQVRIRQVGARTTVELNGKRVVDHARMENYWDRDRPLFRSGPIILQTHGGEIRWRNLAVKELEPTEANDWLASDRAKAFTSLLNGRDLEGWQGATDSYEIADGVLRCKPGEGGNLLTEKEYTDFVIRLEFRLPPGGNNGLAIRAPLEGNPAYAAMCELQVLDSTHPKFANLDPRQYHGSAYGIAAAERGFLRPTGQWNFQEVTVNGSRVQVELNGSLILNTDLSEVTQFMADRSHPGIDRTRGFFGFAGHSDPVEFRNVAIRELPEQGR